MTTLELDVGDLRPIAVTFTAEELVVTLADGRKIATPLSWYPRLKDACRSAREHFEIMPLGIHWPELDEDLGVAWMLKGRSALAQLIRPTRRMERPNPAPAPTRWPKARGRKSSNS
jgi:hypothetical protein